jgi:alpha-mannosidase
LETLLTAAEKAGALLQWLGRKTDPAVLWRAWEPMLFNQAHDLMSGVMTDHVYEDTIRGYDFAKTTAEVELQSRLRRVAAQVDTRGQGTPVVVFNTLGWTRTDMATVTVGFTGKDAHGVQVTGPDGRPVPCQIVEANRHADGTLANARILFLAADVPSMGYAAYHVSLTAVADAVSTEPPPEGVLENNRYRLELDRSTGAITKLMVKDGNWNALDGPGNVVAMEPDKGDFWELYRSLDGGSRIAMKQRHDPPAPGQAILSTDQTAEPGTAVRGPVMQEFTASHPLGEKGWFRTTVRLYAGVRRIEIHTKILNQDMHVRYRALFPTALRQGQAVHEIPFGAIQRPDGIEFPAQNWIDWGNGQQGVALLNRGLPGNNVASGTMMLSLMRSTRIVAYGFGGGYEPGMSSDTGLELGKQRSFDYALVPHDGAWNRAGIHRDGMEFNHPLLAVAVKAHAGKFPNRWGLIEMTGPGVVMSSLKPGADQSLVLRVYEATGKRAKGVRIRGAAAIRAAEEVNLLEDPIRQLKVSRGVLQVDLCPFEIKTLKLRLQARK